MTPDDEIRAVEPQPDSSFAIGFLSGFAITVIALILIGYVS